MKMKLWVECANEVICIFKVLKINVNKVLELCQFENKNAMLESMKQHIKNNNETIHEK